MKNFLSGLRDGLRVIVMSIISWLITDGILAFFVDSLYGTQLDIRTRLVLISGITALLKGVERWYYKAYPDNKVSGALKFDIVK